MKYSVPPGLKPKDLCGIQCGGEPVPCTVMDPFLGSGTTALVALKHGRRAIGIELNAKYADMARRRISAEAGLLT
jgi:hypothetical protein